MGAEVGAGVGAGVADDTDIVAAGFVKGVIRRFDIEGVAGVGAIACWTVCVTATGGI